MGPALALVVVGVLILMDRMGMGYGLRQGWPWVVIALGTGGIIRNRRSPMAWTAFLIGALVLGGKYYSIHFSVPRLVKTYFLPVLLIAIGILWLWKYRRD